MFSILLVPSSSTSLPRCCRFSNGTTISDCTCLHNDSIVVGQTVEPGGYRHFHWAVSNYLDLDDETGRRRDISFEVSPCRGSASLFVRALELPFPSQSNAHYRNTRQYQANALQVPLMRAHYYISVQGADADAMDSSSGGASENDLTTPYGVGSPTEFQIIVKLSGKQAYPVPGDGGHLSISSVFTDALLLPNDTMSMRVGFAPVSDDDGSSNAAGWEYRVYSAATNSSGYGAPCSHDGFPGACITSTVCGIQRAMLPATPWVSVAALSGRNASIEVAGLRQNTQYLFSVIGRPTGLDLSVAPHLAVVYTSETGMPTYSKATQLHSDTTILITLGVILGVVFLLFAIAFMARARLMRAFQARRDRKRIVGKRDSAGNSKGASLISHDHLPRASAAGTAGAGAAAAAAGADSKSKDE